MSRKKIDTQVDFIGVGVPRAGTTWLSQCLEEHPEICFSDPKETHFFDRNVGKPYSAHFSHCVEEKVKGEFSPSYYRFPEVGEEIAAAFPKVKLLVCLRDPAKRAVSHYTYDMHKYGASRSFVEVLTDLSDPYIDYGFYCKHLQRFLGHFDRDQVLFIFDEEMKNDSAKVIAEVYAFLGVDAAFTPDSLQKEINTTRRSGYVLPSFNRHVKLLKKGLLSRRWGRYVVRLIHLFRLNYVVRMLTRFNVKRSEVSSSVATAEQQEQLRALYHKDSKRLGEIYGLDVPWLK